MSEMFEEKVQQKTKTCPALGIQNATVGLPVKINPFAITGPAKLQCCGQPIVLPSCDRCRGKVNGACEFTITQKIRVELPVEFGATVNVGETFVECGCTSHEEPSDCHCKDEH